MVGGHFLKWVFDIRMCHGNFSQKKNPVYLKLKARFQNMDIFENYFFLIDNHFKIINNYLLQIKRIDQNFMMSLWWIS